MSSGTVMLQVMDPNVLQTAPLQVELVYGMRVLLMLGLTGTGPVKLDALSNPRVVHQWVAAGSEQLLPHCLQKSRGRPWSVGLSNATCSVSPACSATQGDAIILCAQVARKRNRVDMRRAAVQPLLGPSTTAAQYAHQTSCTVLLRTSTCMGGPALAD